MSFRRPFLEPFIAAFAPEAMKDNPWEYQVEKFRGLQEEQKWRRWQWWRALRQAGWIWRHHRCPDSGVSFQHRSCRVEEDHWRLPSQDPDDENLAVAAPEAHASETLAV